MKQLFFILILALCLPCFGQTLTKIVIMSDAHYMDADSAGDETHGYEKVGAAINQGISSGCVVLMTMGDMIYDSEERYGAVDTFAAVMADTINGDDGTYPHSMTPLIVLGNHEVDDPDTSTPIGDKPAWIGVSGQTPRVAAPANAVDMSYYIDVAGVRYVAMDSNFNVSDVALPYNATYGYVPEAQKTWLASTLAAADALGYVSVVAVHHPIHSGTMNATDAADIRAIIDDYKVVAVWGAHDHTRELGDTVVGDGATNIDGQTIYYSRTDAGFKGVQTSGYGVHYVMTIDTTNGYMVSIQEYASTATNELWENTYDPDTEEPEEVTVITASSAGWLGNDDYANLYTDYNASTTPNFTTSDFDDSLWTDSTTPHGYGEVWLTTLYTDPGTGFRDQCLFYRKTFTVYNTSQATGMRLNAICDDGCVVFLNGVELTRLGMDPGVIINTQLANRNVFTDPPENTWENDITIDHADPTSLLVDGENIIAISHHNFLATSPDLSFDFAMIVEGPVSLTPPQTSEGPMAIVEQRLTNEDSPQFGSLMDTGDNLMDGLVAWYPFVEGDELVDFAGEYNGTITDATWQGQGLRFAGGTDKVGLGNEMFAGFPELSIILSIKKTTTEDGALIGAWNAAGFNKVLVRAQTANALQFFLHNGSSQAGGDTGITIDTGSVDHIAVTFDGTTMRAYQKGAIGSTTYNLAGPIDDVSSPSNIGGEDGAAASSFIGNIYDVKIYNRALTQEEIQALYESTNEVIVQETNYFVYLPETPTPPAYTVGLIPQEILMPNSNEIFGMQLDTGKSLRDGLVALYPFLEADELVDFTGTYNGTLENITWFGDYARFETASASHIHTGIIDTDIQESTFIFHVRLNGAIVDDEYLLDSSAGATGYALRFSARDGGTTNGVVAFAYRDGELSTVVSASPHHFVPGEWYWLAFTHRAAYNELYIGTDYYDKGDNYLTPGIDVADTPVVFGANYGGTNNLDCDIAYSAVYDRPLSKEEVFAIFQNKNEPLELEPLWSIDDGTRPTPPDFVGIVMDEHLQGVDTLVFGTLPALDNNLVDELVASYPFVEADELVDFAGENHGTITGATWQGEGLSFNGTSDRVDAPIILTMPYSLVVTFSSPATTNRVIFSVADSGETSYDSIGLTGVGVNIYASTFNAAASAAISPDATIAGKEYTVVAVFRSATLRELYIDGQFITKNTENRSLAGTIDRSSIGVSADGTPFGYFDGSVSDAKSYNRALTQEEVQALYENSKRTFEKEAFVIHDPDPPPVVEPQPDMGYLRDIDILADQQPIFGVRLKQNHWSTDNLRLYCPMVEASEVLDLSPYETHGTIFSTARWEGDSLNSTTAFQAVTFGQPDSINVFDGDYTVGIWVRTTSTTDKGHLIGQYSAAYPRWGLRTRDTAAGGGAGPCIYARAVTAKRVWSTTPVNDGKWHMVVQLRRGTAGYMYVDGIDRTAGDDTLEADFNDCPADLGICDSGTGAAIIANTKYAFIYGRGLSDEEIQLLYQNPNEPLEQFSYYLLPDEVTPELDRVILHIGSGIYIGVYR